MRTTLRLAALAGGLALVQGAAAHGPPGGGVGYVSTVSGLVPSQLGVIVNVLGGDDRLQLVNYSGKPVVVYGYQGEPFLRFDRTGVYANDRSPATFQSLVRNPAQAVVPTTVDAQARPLWKKVSEGTTWSWHDHRIHWTRQDLPKIIRDHPRETHRIFNWKVPARAGSERFAVTGFLGYRPPPQALAAADAKSGWVVAAALGCVVLAAAVIGAGARRAKRQAP